MGDVNTPDGAWGFGRALECQNVDRVQIPAYGAADIVGAFNQDNRIIFQIKTPQEFGWRPCSVVIGDNPVQPQKFGSCYDAPWVRCLYNPADGSPAAGDVWGPADDSTCQLRKYVPGGRVFRDVSANDGTSVQVPQNTVLIHRYEPLDICGQLVGTSLAPGLTVAANLVWYNPLLSVGGTPSSKFQNVPNMNFNVTEATGMISTSVPFLAYVFARWDEQSGKYHLRGWTC